MTVNQKTKISPKYVWLIYISLIASALMLLGDGMDIQVLSRMTTRLGGTVLFGAFFLIVGRNRPSGIIAACIIVVAFVITLFN